MRTTLILDDQLFRRAKREARDMGAALSELVNTALRSYFFTKKSFEQNHPHFQMPVFGEPVHFHQTAAQLAELRDEGRWLPMQTPDVNILIYAHRREDPNHEFYRAWVERLANGSEPFAV